MWFRLEAPAMPESPKEVSEELAWIAYRLRASLEYDGFDARSLGVILDVNGTDMVAYGAERATGRHTEAARAFKLWEQCQPRESLSQPQRQLVDDMVAVEEKLLAQPREVAPTAPWPVPTGTKTIGRVSPPIDGQKLVSPRCGTCEHTAPHFQAAGQDVCTHTDADGTNRCGCENYVAEFELPRVAVKAPNSEALLLDLEFGTLNRMR